MDGIDAAARREFGGGSLRLETKPVDLPRAAREADVVVLHAGQGATAGALLAGRPVLQIPLLLEQRLTAAATVRLGAGEAAAVREGDEGDFERKLGALMAEERFAGAARRFAEKHVGFDGRTQASRMTGRVEGLLAAGRARAGAGVRGIGAAGARRMMRCSAVFRGVPHCFTS